MDGPLNWIPVNSSAIAEIGYDPFTLRLWIRFKSGQKAYQFDGFPTAKWQLFLKAGSKGTFFHQQIQGRYKAL